MKLKKITIVRRPAWSRPHFKIRQLAYSNATRNSRLNQIILQISSSQIRQIRNCFTRTCRLRFFIIVYFSYIRNYVLAFFSFPLRTTYDCKFLVRKLYTTMMRRRPHSALWYDKIQIRIYRRSDYQVRLATFSPKSFFPNLSRLIFQCFQIDLWRFEYKNFL